MKNKFLNIMRYVLGFVIIGALVYKVGLVKIADTLSNITAYALLSFILIYIVSFTFSTTNIFMLLKCIHKKPVFSNVLHSFVNAWALGLLLPSKLGDFSMPFFLKTDSIDLGTGFATVFVDRLISFFVIYVFASFGVSELGKNFLLNIALVGLFIIAVITLFKFGFVKKIIGKFFVNKYINLNGFYETLVLYSRKKRLLAFNFLLSLINVLLSTLVIYIFFRTYGANVNFLTVLFIFSMVKIVSLIPLTPGGSGLKEVSAVYLFGLAGVDNGITIGVFLTILIFNYLTAFISLCILKKPKSQQPAHV